MAASTTPREILWLRTRPLVSPTPDISVDVAVQVATVALADHPGAVVDRVEADPTGWYTAHLVTGFGQQVVVPVDRDLTVTGWVALAR